MNEYLNSKSFLLPGVAAATTTTITSSLVSLFNLPGNWTALTISLLFGLTVWADKEVAFALRIPLYFINSLIIFSMAFGINSAGEQAFRPPEQQECIERFLPSDSDSHRLFQPWDW